MKKLRIAQLAPFWYDVPPKNYGGTERIVSYITEELVRRGHDVTLFASEGSVTKARLVSPISSTLLPSIERYCDTNYNTINSYVCAYVFRHAGEFDIIHSHASYFAFHFCSFVQTPTLHTLHNYMPRPRQTENEIFKKYHDLLFVSISNDFRRHFDLNYIATVYHGTPLATAQFREHHEDYVFWIGRINKHKGELDALEFSQKTGEKTVMAISLTPDTKEYLETMIMPGRTPRVEIAQNVSFNDVWKLYAGAKALLFPIHWEEPFGMVMIEALSCGTPVVAYARGSVPEIIKDGVTGFIVDPPKEDTIGETAVSPGRPVGGWIIKKRGIEGIIEAVRRIKEIDRNACRKDVEKRFTVEKMADGYERVYAHVLGHNS